MPATQISFLAFAQAAQQQATVCAPPVTQAASVLVAQPVAADGGECIHIDLRRVHIERPAFSSMRGDFFLDGLHPGWAGFALDAPSFLPSGSAVVLGLGAGYPFINSGLSRPGAFA